MKTKLTASEVRAFLEAANKQFEEGGIYLEPHRRLTKWFRTRSNPVNKRGGQRARDKHRNEPQRE